jgi:hypothetical protein
MLPARGTTTAIWTNHDKLLARSSCIYRATRSTSVPRTSAYVGPNEYAGLCLAQRNASNLNCSITKAHMNLHMCVCVCVCARVRVCMCVRERARVCTKQESATFGAQLSKVLTLGHFGKQIRNSWHTSWNVVLEKAGTDSWTGRVGNEVGLLHRVKERDIPQTIKRRKANWTSHILRRNCLLKHVTEGEIEGGIDVTGRWGRRRKQLWNDLKDMTRYRKLKGEAPDRTVWRTRFARGYKPVLRQTTEWKNINGRRCRSHLYCVPYLGPLLPSRRFLHSTTRGTLATCHQTQ